MHASIEGRLWMRKDDQGFLGQGRIELLRHIGTSGSITQAAKAMKMSYKAAWDAIDAMNNLSQLPLVETLKGGKGGGGTHLTPYAQSVIATYEVLQEEHQKFLERLSARIDDKNGTFGLLQSLDVRLSARNQLKAQVLAVEKGVVESEIVLSCAGGLPMRAVITNDSLHAMQLAKGSSVYALFKANTLVVCTDPAQVKSDMNKLTGRIVRIEKDSFNAEIIIEISPSHTVCSVLSIEAFLESELKVGMQVSAFCKPKNIILGIW